MRASLLVAVAAMLLPAAAAEAQERDYCPERPGITTPPCTMAPGRVSVEASFADWTHDNTATARMDEVMIGDALIRIGVADVMEARIGWTPYGHVRVRDGLTNLVDARGGTGDLTLGLKANLREPTGDDLSIAILPSVTLPTGGAAIGAGDWAAGLLLPLSFSVSDTVSLVATPGIAAAADEDRHGRHLRVEAAGGVSLALTELVSLTGEIQWLRDRDPDGHATQTFGGLAAAWTLGDDLQLDAASVIGLNRAAPDVEFYAGISRRF